MSTDDKLTRLHGHEDKDLSALYHSADKPEPPTHLDAKIRAAAHAATPKRYRRPAYWLPGIAATLVVGVLVVQLYPAALQAPREALEYQAAAPAMEADALRVQRAPEKSDPAALSRKEEKLQSVPLPLAEAREEILLGKMADQAEVMSVAPASSPAPDQAPDPISAAAPRLQAILDLLEANDIAAAQRAWDDFSKDYPDYPLTAEQQRKLSPLKRDTPRQ